MSVSFDMTKSNYGGVDMGTDASSYSTTATSIDYKIWKVGESSHTIYYIMALEWWDGSRWIAQELQTGYFNYSTPTKLFYLAGKPGGSYRFTCYINEDCSNCGTTFINRTAAFIVKR